MAESENKKTDEDVLKDSRESLRISIDDDAANRKAMLDDLRFCTLDQWPDEIRKEREDTTQDGGARPCLTIDKINQYIVQVVNDMRQGKPGINVRPVDDGADVETAKILKGLVRNIEDQSNADIAYATGGESQCRVGLGFWRVTTEYVSAESFDQEIFIRSIPNTFSVYMSRHMMPDGSDAKKAWVIEEMPVERFKREFPGKKYSTENFSDLGEGWEYWCSEETVTVVEYFYIESTRIRLYFLADGTTISEADYDKWPESAGAKPTVVEERTTFKEQLKWCKHTGTEILESRDLPGKYIPIVEVVGREAFVEGRRMLWGLVRPAKDSLRMYNYWASTITEKMGLAPKSPYLGAKGQFSGVEEKWKKANKTNYSYLEYEAIEINGNAVPPPQRVGPTPMEASLVQHMQVIEHDVQTALGMFKAATGESESQQSGRAILALQRESDTGTYHFGANQGISIRHTGRIIVDLIPHYYDTKRIVRILGEDGTHQTVTIDPEQEDAYRKVQGANGMQSIYNPGVGKYDVAITVGPSYNTKRMEAAATLTEVVKSQPQLLPIIGDLLFRSLDFPYSDQIAERMKKMLPPQLQDGANPEAMVAELQQKLAMAGQQLQEVNAENMQLKAGAQVKMAAVSVDAEAKSKAHELAVAEANESLKLEREKAEQDAQFQIWKAKLDAAAKIEVAEINSETALSEAAMQAETDVNVELSSLIKDGPESTDTSGDSGDSMSIKGPQKFVRPLDKIVSLHEQGMNMHSQQATELQGAVAQLGAILQQLVSLQQQTLAVMQAPKSVSVGSVQKDASGQIIGAQVNSRPTLN